MTTVFCLGTGLSFCLCMC